MGIKVLSLFDGMSCGRLALERAGIEVEQYYASEINKFAIKIAEKNFPDTVQLGDVCGVKYGFPDSGFISFGDCCSGLPYAYKKNIDLLIGGSPCQGFSRVGKQLNFEDPKSKLFFEFVRILKETKPKYFLLENVRMKPEYKRIITQHLDWVEPVFINSSLLSAQNRERLYWVGELQEDGTYRTVDVPQPKDKKIFLKDILQDEVDEKYFVSERLIQGFLNKSGGFEGKFKISTGNDKGACLTSHAQGSVITQTYINQKGRIRKLTPLECERLQTVPDNYTEGVSDTQRYKMLGNGWTVDVIAHIFQYLLKNKKDFLKNNESFK